MYLDRLYTLLCIFTLLLCFYILDVTNTIQTLCMFFLSVLIYYTYCASINNNFVRVVIILWYARSITVLFYLLASFSGSTNYSLNYTTQKNYIKSRKSTLLGLGFLTVFMYASYHFKHYIFSYALEKSIIMRALNNYYDSEYTNFISICNSIGCTPSSIYLILYLLPLFLFVIYFICDYLSYKRKK